MNYPSPFDPAVQCIVNPNAGQEGVCPSMHLENGA